MKTLKTNWTKEEGNFYLILYLSQQSDEGTVSGLMNCDDNMHADRLRAICREFMADNDYRCLQKILHHFKTMKYSKIEVLRILAETKKLMLQSDRLDHQVLARMLTFNKLLTHKKLQLLKN